MPILPDYLAQLHHANTVLVLPATLKYKNFDLHYVPDIISGSGGGSKHPLAGNSLINFTVITGRDPTVFVDSFDVVDESAQPSADTDRNLSLVHENGSVGILLAAKALVQLAITPLVGGISQRLGYRIPVVFGTFCLFVAALGKFLLC